MCVCFFPILFFVLCFDFFWFCLFDFFLSFQHVLHNIVVVVVFWVCLVFFFFFWGGGGGGGG